MKLTAKYCFSKKYLLFIFLEDKSGNLDLKLMIYILKRRFDKESKAEFVDQLEVIDKIRREIVQSSSGLLDEPKFHETLDRMTKVCRKREYLNTFQHWHKHDIDVVYTLWYN